MTTYERVVDGEVVERVTPIDGSHEDTRLGVLVLEGGSEWRRADTTTEPATSNTPAPAGDSNDTTTPDASQPGPNTSEEPDGPATTDGDGTGSDGNQPRGRRQRS